MKNNPLDGIDTYDLLSGMTPTNDEERPVKKENDFDWIEFTGQPYDLLKQGAPKEERERPVIKKVGRGITRDWTTQDLRDYESDLTKIFEAGRIKAPVHFAGGNEENLIKIFSGIEKEDWVLCSWRSHYHCLLKGVPEREVTAAIVRGRSIALCFPEYKLLSSAIVGGIAPIAVGMAWSIKQNGGSEVVHCFLGDMTAETGIVHEAIKYGTQHDLPVKWIVEDNKMSVSTPTKKVWGEYRGRDDVTRYHHTLTMPHVGTGKWVKF